MDKQIETAYAEVGKILGLFNQSAVHASWSLAEVMDDVLPALAAGQYRLYQDRNGRPVAFASWAFLSDEAHEALLSKERCLDADEWTSGEHIWVMDFVAPYGHAHEVAGDLKRYARSLGLSGNTIHWTRAKPTSAPERTPMVGEEEKQWQSHFYH